MQAASNVQQARKWQVARRLVLHASSYWSEDRHGWEYQKRSPHLTECRCGDGQASHRRVAFPDHLLR
jgi:hypothetical protein